MRFLLTFALCAWPALAQTNQEAESNMSCVERLQLRTALFKRRPRDTNFSPRPSRRRFESRHF
jgi:hypothetical protein